MIKYAVIFFFTFFAVVFVYPIWPVYLAATLRVWVDARCVDMDLSSSAELGWSTWSRSSSVSRRQRRGDEVRTVTLDDRQVRILPKYRRRQRRHRALDWTRQCIYHTDDAMTGLNGSVVQAPTTAGRRPCRKDGSERQAADSQRTRSSAQVWGGSHREVDLPPDVRHSQTQPVPPGLDDDDNDDVATALRMSDDEDHDVDEQLNASTSSRITASKLTTLHPHSAAMRELPCVDELDHRHTVGQRLATCCRSFIGLLASTLGLTCLLVVYTLLGGALFVCPNCAKPYNVHLPSPLSW